MANALSVAHIEEFERIYDLFDANGDGYLTAQEITDALEVLGRGITLRDRKKLFALIEEGRVTRDRFLEWMAQRQDIDVSTDLRQIFQLIDKDGSGRISYEEFLPIVQCLDPGASDLEIDALANRADLDGDGQIDFEEFIATQAIGSKLKLTISALRSFKKILTQYAKVAAVSSMALIEVDSDLGAGKRGASKGIDFLKTLAMEKQAARSRAENGVVSLDSRAVQNENHALSAVQRYPHAKYIDAIYKVLARTADVVSETLRDGLFPIVLGGDHSTAAGTIAGIKAAFPNRRLGVVWIDAHADIHSPYTTPSGNMHGMPLAIATGHNNFPQQNNILDSETNKLWKMCQALGVEHKANLALQDLIYVSVRDTEAAEDYTIACHNIPIITTQQLRQQGAVAAAKQCLDYLAQVDIIYVTFDVDSMDSTICMGTGTPASGGLWAKEARLLNEALVKDPRVCCWEICEINPLLDTLNTMAENSLGVFEAVVDAIATRLSSVAS